MIFLLLDETFAQKKRKKISIYDHVCYLYAPDLFIVIFQNKNPSLQDANLQKRKKKHSMPTLDCIISLYILN